MPNCVLILCTLYVADVAYTLADVVHAWCFTNHSTDLLDLEQVTDVIMQYYIRNLCYSVWIMWLFVISFDVNGPTTWNSLPPALREPELSQNAFIRALKTHLFSSAPPRPPATVGTFYAIPAPNINTHTYLLTLLTNGTRERCMVV